jgi:hypothetical protein
MRTMPGNDVSTVVDALMGDGRRKIAPFLLIPRWPCIEKARSAILVAVETYNDPLSLPSGLSNHFKIPSTSRVSPL